MRKVYFPWRYALTGVVAMSLLTPVALSATEAPAEAPQAKAADAQRTVTGVVTDGQDGEPLIGATVQVKGNKSAVTITDIDGNFSINVSGRKAVLVISYVGYKTREVPVDDLSYLEVQMVGDENTLDEVVVVGAGTQKKVSVTGAISSVSGEALRMPSSTLTTALAGKMPGIISTQTSGEPGSQASFYIRGISTFGGRTTPLILLDDVEISANDLDYVPADNIESFSILKDASATAIYGARGANGVMIVKTKGGDYNMKTNIGIRVENAFNFVGDFPDFVDGVTFMELRNKAQAMRSPGTTPKYSEYYIENTRNNVNPYVYPNVDWYDELFRDMSMRQKANISITGGGSKVKYYVSLDAQHEDGILNTKKLYSFNNNINIYNYTFQNNTTIKVTPTTTVSLRMNAQIRQNTGPNTNAATIFNSLLTTPPVIMPTTFPAVEGIDHIRYATVEVSASNFNTNPPYVMMNTTFNQWNQNTINTVLNIDQELDMITKGLSLHAWVNFKNWASSSYNRQMKPYLYVVDKYDLEDPYGPYTTRLVNNNGSDFIETSDISKSSDNTFEMQANLNWQRSFGSNNLTAMVLYRMREYRNDVLPNRNQGISGRITYDYDRRYLAEFNFGYNGTERLAKGDRFGFFPAASIGWVASSEKFFEPLTQYIQHLKLRASYGLTGSDDLASPDGSHFLYIDKITNNSLTQIGWNAGPGYGYYNYGAGPELAYLAMQGIGWEKSRKLDIGLELNFLNDFRLTADYFFEHRYDIFLQRKAWPQSLAYGKSKPWSNVGKMDNQGVEFSLSWNRRIGDVNLGFEGSFTYSKNKVIDWDTPYYEMAWVPEANEGVRYGSIFGYVAEGLFQSQEEIDNSPRQDLGSIVMVGDIKYRDINGDGLITSQDQVLLTEQSRTPMITYGFGVTAQWKKWDFGVQFTGSGKRAFMMNGMDPFQENISTSDRNVLQWIADNYFDPEKGNFDALYPRLGNAITDVANNTVASSYWLRNGNFLRLKNITLGWSFKYGRIYVDGANLLRFSKFKIWDPELGSWNAYPMSKTVNVGIQLNI